MPIEMVYIFLIQISMQIRYLSPVVSSVRVFLPRLVCLKARLTLIQDNRPTVSFSLIITEFKKSILIRLITEFKYDWLS